MSNFLIFLPLFILPFFDQTSVQWPFIYFLAAGLALAPIIFSRFRSQPAAPDGKTGILWIFLLIQLLLLIASSYSISLPASILELALFTAAAAWYFWGTTQQTDDIRWIWAALVITGGLMSLVSMAIAVNLLPLPVSSVNLLVRTFGHNRLAGYLLFAIPAGIAGLGSENWNKQRIISLLSLAAMVPVFLLSGGRAAMIGMVLGLWYLAKFGLGENPRLKSLLSWSLAGVLVTLFIFLSVPLIFRAKQINFPIYKIEPLKSVEIMINRPLSGDARWDYWSQAVRAVREDPKGWGGGTFKFLSLHYREPHENVSSFVHNQYLQMLAEGGILGGLIYLALVISGLAAAHQGAKRMADPLVTSLVAGAMGSALAAAGDFDWQFPSIFLLFWLILGMTGKAQGSRKWTVPAGILMLLTGLYGAGVLFFNFGIGFLAGRLEKIYILGHPQLQKKVIELSGKELSAEEFGLFLKRNVKYFQYDNSMLEKVLSWQEKYDTPESRAQTAAMMLDNDPLNITAKD